MNIYDSLEIILYKYNETIVRRLYRSPVVDTIDTTIEKLINGCSISRYGDGEIDIILGRNKKFQSYNRSLAKRLKTILKLNGKYKGFLVGIPQIFDSLEIFTEEASFHWKIRMNKERYRWYNLLNRNESYANSQITRFYFDWRDKTNCKKWIEKMKQLWHSRSITLVEGCYSRLGVGNDLFSNAKDISRILCPNVNAFNCYSEIIRAVLRQSKEKLVLIALGPTATILAYDLFQLGYQAVDIGHIDIEYEWYLDNTTKKMKVLNKFVNEVEESDIIEEHNDETYRRQIIERLNFV